MIQLTTTLYPLIAYSGRYKGDKLYSEDLQKCINHCIYFESIICPASKLHITVLVIKREPCDVNLTRGLENTRRNVGTAPRISHHHIGREGAIKLLISTATISVKFFHFYIISTDLLYMRTSGFQMFLKNRILIILREDFLFFRTFMNLLRVPKH